MTTVTLHAEGAADPSQAWERYAEPARWPEWSPQIRGVSSDAERIAAGVTGRVHGPLGVSVNFVVDSVDESARRWAWTVRFGLVQLKLDHRVTAHARGSSTTLRVEGPLPIVLGYAPVARFALGRLVAR